MRHMPCRS